MPNNNHLYRINMMMMVMNLVVVSYVLYVHTIMPPTRNVELNELIEISRKYSDIHVYNRTTFNCQNYTNDIVDIGTELGFNVMAMKGCPEDPDENNTCHAWVRWYADIEPQSGVIKDDYSTKYPHQTITSINCYGCKTKSIPSR